MLKNAFSQLKAKKNLFLTVIFLTLIFLILTPAVYKNKKKNQLEKKPQFNTKLPFKRSLKHLWGKPAKLMFPEINKPQYVNKKEAGSFLNNSDKVLLIKGKSRLYIYPLSILSFHHIVNDQIDNQPIAVTFCLLTDTSIVYSRKIKNKLLSFGVLGPLYYGNLVMYDKETDSYWIQLTGEGIKGRFKNKKLKMAMTIEETKWKNIKNLSHLKILKPQRPMEFYRNFYSKFKDSQIGLHALKKVKEPNKKLSPYTKGLGIVIQNQAKFYPLSTIKKQGLIDDILGGWSLVIFHDNRLETNKIFRGYLEGEILSFKKTNRGLIDKQTNSKWNFDGLATAGPLKGKRLNPPAYAQTYWFAWSAFYPETSIYQNPKK